MSLFNILLQTGARVADRFFSRPAAPSGGVPVTWFMVEPHQLGQLRRQEPDAVSPLGLARELDARGMHALAEELRGEFAARAEASPGRLIFVKVGH